MNRETIERKINRSGDIERSLSRSEEPESVNALQQILLVIFGTIISLLTLRFISSLIGANPNNMVIDLINSLSYPFVAPFEAIFSTTSVNSVVSVSRFDIASVVAIVVYMVVAWVFLQFANAINNQLKV